MRAVKSLFWFLFWDVYVVAAALLHVKKFVMTVALVLGVYALTLGFYCYAVLEGWQLY